MRFASIAFAASVACLAATLGLGCSEDSPADTAGSGASLPTSASVVGSSATSGTGGAGGASSSSASSGTGGSTSDVLCPATFSYKLGAGQSSPRVAGAWNGFDLAQATPLTGPDAQGKHSGVVSLPPGLHAYKIVYDDAGGTQWILDPEQGRRKYDGGIENSGIKVADCRLPTFAVVSSKASRPSPGQGAYQASLTFQDGIGAEGPDTTGFSATLVRDGVPQALSEPSFGVDASGNVTLDVTGLADGKYTLVLTGKTKDGYASLPLRLVFWVEAEDFSWKDALIYMVVTDRYRDGDTSNNAPATPNADPRGDWYGGDLEGLRASIDEGKLDALGVRAIWLTPFQTNPASAYKASDDVHYVTGYHGYWPTRAREVDPRIGGEAALHALVKEAHEHGIRILQDFVMNHVHEDHEYVAAHEDWFRTGCVCGTQNCDWTGHALDCMFSPYLPDINHTVPEANAQFVEDAIYWLDTFDLDGLRVDAVKHVEEIATRNLAAEVREGFEAAGTRYFLMGETAMGWGNCPDPCNDENYGTISKYIGPYGLDGQFDFVLYHGVSYNTFAYGNQGMLHADYWTQHGLSKYPAEAIMTPYIGSHDTARFSTLADYRGQDGAHDMGIPGNQWSNTAAAPSDAEPYVRTRIAMAWLLGLPGAPLMYYGDEYGQWGGADPNNRLMWRDGASLTSDEQATLAYVQKLGVARQKVPAMRRGDYVPLGATEDTLVFGRKMAGGSSAIVGVSRAPTAQSITVEVALSLGIPALSTLHDELGGPDVSVPLSGSVSISVPASGAVILSP